MFRTSYNVSVNTCDVSILSFTNAITYVGTYLECLNKRKI